MKIDKLIETNFQTIHPSATLGQLVKIVANSTRNIYPVVKRDNTFLGLVILDDIRHIMFKPELYESTYVRDLMFTPVAYVTPDDSMEDVAMTIQKTNRFNIVVLKDGKYVGFVSRANVFSTYRSILKDFSED